MTDLSPKQCLDRVKKDKLYKRIMNSLEVRYHSVPVKDEALKMELLERVNKRMEEAPRCIPLLWEDLHDVIEVITYGWDELVKLGFSSPLLLYSIISLCMLQRIDEWFEEDKKVKPKDVKPVAIPEQCSKAEAEVFTPYIKSEEIKGIVTGREFVRKAMNVILDKKSPAKMALLLMICLEVKAVKADVQNPDFIRALIGLRILPYEGEDAILTMANGMSKKLNGNSRNGKKSPLPSEHKNWNKKDKIIGDSIISIFT